MRSPIAVVMVLCLACASTTGEGEGEDGGEGEGEVGEGEGEVGEGEGEVGGEGEGEVGGEGEGEPAYPPPLSGDEVAEQVGVAMFGFLEGPVYDAVNDRVLFSDIPGNTIWSVPLDDDVFTDFISPSGNSNGLLFDASGTLHICEHSGRRISTLEADGSTNELISEYEGNLLNSPNDMVFDDAGNLYFTDPPYGGNPNNLGFAGLFMMRPSGVLELIMDDYPTPNGVALSPDGYTLYVSDSGEGFIDAYDVAAPGLPTNRRRFQTVEAPDGLAIDDAGNLYAATADGVHVYGADGGDRGLVATTNNASNVAFAGADRQWLYVTSGAALFRTRVDVPGKL
jgi:gluconolactonase